MALALFPRGPSFVRSACLAAVLGIALVSPALASLAAPWATTELDGAEALASGHGRYVAVGRTGSPAQAAAWTSADGLTWEEAAVTGAPSGSAMTDVVATDDGFVAFGLGSLVNDWNGERVLAWFSPDGLEWQAAVVTAPSKSGRQVFVHSLADGSAGTLALGSFNGDPTGAGRLWRSADGPTWERVKLPKAMRDIWLTDVVPVPQGYLLLGRTLSGVPHNWRSADGVTWKELGGTPLLFDVAASDNGALVGIGFEDIYFSPKSLRGWERVLTVPKRWKVNTANSFGWVGWDGAEFVVVGNDNSPCGPASNDIPTDPCHREPLLVSVDGTYWSEAAGPDGLPGADEGVWVRDVASLDDSTVMLGLDHGTTTVWTISGGSRSA